MVRIARLSTEVNAMSGLRPAFLISTPAELRLDAALIREIDVMPAGEQILDVPDALAMANQD